MDTMQFRDYIFRHNPQSVTITDGEAVVRHLCPGAGTYIQGLGKQARTVKCCGCFLGDTPEEAFALAAEFRQKTSASQAGMLFVPGLSPFPARLREFVLDAQGDGRALPYTITFLEQEELL